MHGFLLVQELAQLEWPTQEVEEWPTQEQEVEASVLMLIKLILVLMLTKLMPAVEA